MEANTSLNILPRDHRISLQWMCKADAEQLDKPDSIARRKLKRRKLVQRIENLATSLCDKEASQRLDDLAAIIAKKKRTLKRRVRLLS